MSKRRIYEIARELEVSSKDLIAKLEEMGMPGLKAANSVDEEEYALIVNVFREEADEKDTPQQAEPAQEAADEAPPVAGEATPTEAEPAAKAVRRKHKNGVSRPPIVSVLGHIDHGKTTLLDAIRNSRLAEREAGGITQGIAAYQAELKGKKITFIDTPGHKAFTGMRARGARATDIAILVVAADDGVMAQTVEAIDHIRAAGVPMIVAINKIDKANADVNKVINDLAQHGLMPEAWGGDTITVEISALQGQNIDELLEMILLVAEMEDIKADPKGEVEAVVIESHLAVGQGPVATVVVRSGTLRAKDWVVAGETQGRIKALMNNVGKRIDEARPGDAITIMGFCDVPEVGTQIEVVGNQGEARKLAQQHTQEIRKPAVQRPRTFDELFQQEEELAKLKLVLRAASTGGLEAARREITGLDVPGVEVNILSAGVGNITESDVLLASTANEECLIVGFGVKAEGKAARMADQEGIPLFLYDIIYDLVDEIEQALKDQLEPEFAESVIGSAEVRDTFKAPSGVIAGCYVSDGRVERRGKVRVLRNDAEVFVGEIASLRRFEDDVREVQADRECGLRIRDFDGVEIGDRLVFFVLEEVER